MYEDVLSEILIQLPVYDAVSINERSVKVQNDLQSIVIAGDSGGEGDPEIFTVHQ